MKEYEEKSSDDRRHDKTWGIAKVFYRAMWAKKWKG